MKFREFSRETSILFRKMLTIPVERPKRKYVNGRITLICNTECEIIM